MENGSSKNLVWRLSTLRPHNYNYYMSHYLNTWIRSNRLTTQTRGLPVPKIAWFKVHLGINRLHTPSTGYSGKRRLVTCHKGTTECSLMGEYSHTWYQLSNWLFRQALTISWVLRLFIFKSKLHCDFEPYRCLFPFQWLEFFTRILDEIHNDFLSQMTSGLFRPSIVARGHHLWLILRGL